MSSVAEQLDELDHDMDGIVESYDDEERAAIAEEKFFKCTDTGNAERFAHTHAGRVLFCKQMKEWFIWDRVRYAADARGSISQLGKDVVRAIYNEAARCKKSEVRDAIAEWARKSESNDKRGAMLSLARSESGIAVVPSELDADVMLLNTPTATIDLRTGEPRPHRRADRITKCTAAAYVPGARSELWERVVLEAMGGDAETVSFFQRAAGYSATGRTDEEKLFMALGDAATGKSTIIGAIQRALGDYSKTADFEAFLAQKNGGGPRNDIARLAGARFVASIEVDKGKRLAQGLVKTITGGDTVTARFLYAEAFEYRPEFKLWLVANDAPRVPADDAGLWRRILRIPFDHVVPEDKRNPNVKAELLDVKVSGPAILAWLVQGALDWQERGLQVPERVKAATKAYRDSQDIFAKFIAECCTFTIGGEVTRKRLRECFETWAGFRPNATELNEAIRKQPGVDEKTIRGERSWTGIELATDGGQ